MMPELPDWPAAAGLLLFQYANPPVHISRYVLQVKWLLGYLTTQDRDEGSYQPILGKLLLDL